MKDLFTLHEESFTIEISANAISSSRVRNIKKKAARILTDGKQVTQCAVGDIADDQLWQRCQQNMGLALSTNVEMPPIKNSHHEHIEKLLSPNEFEQQVQDLVTKFSTAHSDFLATGKMELTTTNREYKQDEGKRVSRFANISGYLCLKHRASANIIDLVIGVQGDTHLKVDSMVDGLRPFLEKWDHEVSVEAGKRTVCFLSDVSDVLGKVTQSLHPERYHNGTALFSGKKDQAIFHPELNLADLAVDLPNGVYQPFDDEGIDCQGVFPIITKGIFHGPLYDLRTAKLYHAASTGHARRQGGAINPAPINLSLMPGNKSMQQFWQEQRECIVILMAGGGDTTADGDFSTPAQVAFLVREGEVVGRLPQITLRANIRNYLGPDFIGVSCDRMAPGNSPALFTQMEVFLN